MRLSKLVVQNKLYTALAIGSVALSSFFFVLIPVLLGNGVDQAVELLRVGAPQSETLPALIGAALAVLASSSLRGIFGYGQIYFGEMLGQKVIYNLRNQYFEKLQRLSFGFHDRAHTGNLISRGISDMEGLRMFAQTGFLRMIMLVILVGGAAFYMISLDWQLALLTIAFVPIVAFRGSVMQLKLRRIWLYGQEKMGVVNQRVQENLGGIRVVRAFSAQDYEEEKFERSARDVYDLMNEAAGVRASNGSLMSFSLLVAWAIIMWFGGQRVLAGELTVGELTQFVTFMGLLQQPIRQLPMMINAFARAASAGARVFEILDTEVKIQNKPDAKPLVANEGVLRLEHVSFRYREGSDPTIEDINFEARPGHAVAIVGPPGSGKSTIAHLIPRLYDVDGGRVTIDGQDIRDVTLESLRQEVVLVQQDTFLFMDTVADNIAYGEPEAEQERVETSAQSAQMHEHIIKMSEGYQSLVGERGVSMSGGQRQRMAIARALVLKPKVLVFDDSTSAIDAATEQAIRSDLKKVAGDITTVIIAHRLSSIQDADEILVIDNGRIIERGSHRELLQLGGRYKEMHDLQAPPSDDTSADWLSLGSGNESEEERS